MQISGRRIHIAGSASAATNPALINYGHELIAQLVSTLAVRGATFVLGVGKEPTANPGDASSPSIVFDWTALAAVHACLKDGSARPEGPQGRLVYSIATEKTERQIPEHRRPIWQDLLDEGAVELQFVEAGWASGAIRRTLQSPLGDVLVALSGGEGVEHLAQLYAEAGKPMIMLDLDLGASSDDGSGAAARLATRARAHPEHFARFRDPSAAGTLLMGTTTLRGQRPIDEVVEGVVKVIEELAPPVAFYVRTLDPKMDDFAAVDRFFDEVVDPVVRDFGYEPFVMGSGENEYAWMNEAIFDKLHHSAVAIVDLTGLKNNCFLELGYAMGRGTPVLVTAKSGTQLPFDMKMIEYHPWADSLGTAQQQEAWKEYWRRNINRPPLVHTRRVL